MSHSGRGEAPCSAGRVDVQSGKEPSIEQAIARNASPLCAGGPMTYQAQRSCVRFTLAPSVSSLRSICS
jgi:hypothetical protein